MSQQQIDEMMMRRCLQLAANGLLTTKPNPMVGAVIVAADGHIIGEGFTSPVGGPHAEVNAFASVKKEDEPLLPGATIYVSLEPCSHWGHTPPCCDLIISKKVRRCVCGCVDPFACKALNKRFFTFHEQKRPYIILKWAQTTDGFISGKDGAPLKISTPFTKMLVHKLRAENDAILVGRHTVETDHPQLNVREWSGKDPERIILSKTFSSQSYKNIIPEGFTCFPSIDAVLDHLYQEQKQSLIVEGGAQTLQDFIDRGLWDEIRVETAPMLAGEGVRAPQLPRGVRMAKREEYDGNVIEWFVH